MCKKLQICVYVFILLFIHHTSKAEIKQLKKIHEYTISDGLTENGVTSILEDSNGYFWIGTFDGLNRYNGYEFESYKNTTDKKVLISNRIRTLHQDINGNIWIGTDLGISVYLYKKQKFINVYSNKLVNRKAIGPIVRKFYEDKKLEQVIAVTEQGTIKVFNYDFFLLKQYSSQRVLGIKDDTFQIFDIKSFSNKGYLLATSHGLIEYTKSNDSFAKLIERKVNFRNSFIENINDSILIYPLDKGLGIIKYDKKQTHNQYILSKTILDEYKFVTASFDVESNLWLGALNVGVLKITDIHTSIYEKPTTLASFNNNIDETRVSCILSTKTKGIWIGTYNRGVLRFDTKNNPFKHYYAEQNSSHIFTSNNIMNIEALDSNRVFITALGSDIVLFNTAKETFEPLPFIQNKKDAHRVSSVFVDDEKNIWYQNAFKSIRVVPTGQNKSYEAYISKNEEELGYLIRSLVRDTEGNVWYGHRKGIYKIKTNKSLVSNEIYDLNDHSFFEQKKLTEIRSIYSDLSTGYIWIASLGDGLFRVKYKGKPNAEMEIEQYLHNENDPNSICSNFVSSIQQLPNGDLWVGAEQGGISKVVDSGKDEVSFVSFTEKQGLSNHVVKNILYDKNNDLWVSTNNGLNKLDTKTNRFVNFSKDDGLPFVAFKFAAERMKNNTLVFSGYEGICCVTTEDIINQKEAPLVDFGDFKVFNKTVELGDTIGNRVLISNKISHQDEIILKHNENVISIELLSLHYSNPKSHLIKYKLEPLNSEWIVVPSNQRFINYNGLNPGKYTLKVKANNSLSDWSQVKELNLTITPPFWKTPIAIILYVFLLLLIMYVVIFFRLKLYTLKHNLAIEHLEKNKVVEVNDAKLRFFANISHEIKTPLTLISGPVESLVNMYKNRPETSHKLTIIRRQAQKISQLVDQVHDFQRSDGSVLKMNFSNFSFDDFIKGLVAEFDFMALQNKKQLHHLGQEKEIFVRADIDKLEKVFNNLINNAFKYTSEEDSITIEYTQNNKELLVKVTDTGKGIDAEDLPHIFERFYQSQKKHSAYVGGSGIGLAFSKRLVEMHYGYITADSQLDKGTTITVSLPVALDQVPDKILEIEQVLIQAESEQPEDIDILHEVDDIVVDTELLDIQIFLVEDNDDLRAFVTEALQKYFNVRAFVNGRACNEALESEWPDIIISDVLMPEMNGFELCRNVKSNIKTSHIPVILLTACTSMDDELQGLNDGADSYIKKPFNLQFLIANIQSLLHNRGKLRERYRMRYPLFLKKEEVDTSDVDAIFLEKMYAILSENLDNPEFEVKELAKMLFINRTNFYRKVKALTGKTPFELIKDFRITKAAEFLKQGNINVNDAVTMTGFKSRTHFSKLFKDKYGVSPGRYTE